MSVSGLGGTSDKTMEICWTFHCRYKILYHCSKKMLDLQAKCPCARQMPLYKNKCNSFSNYFFHFPIFNFCVITLKTDSESQGCKKHAIKGSVSINRHFIVLNRMMCTVLLVTIHSTEIKSYDQWRRTGSFAKLCEYTHRALLFKVWVVLLIFSCSRQSRIQPFRQTQNFMFHK